MHVVKKKTLQDFWRVHPAAELPLRAWLKDAERANWRSFHEIKAYARLRILLVTIASCSMSAETSSAWWCFASWQRDDSTSVS
jgi:hypothetical protein